MGEAAAGRIQETERVQRRKRKSTGIERAADWLPLFTSIWRVSSGEGEEGRMRRTTSSYLEFFPFLLFT